MQQANRAFERRRRLNHITTLCLPQLETGAMRTFSTTADRSRPFGIALANFFKRCSKPNSTKCSALALCPPRRTAAPSEGTDVGGRGHGTSRARCWERLGRWRSRSHVTRLNTADGKTTECYEGNGEHICLRYRSGRSIIGSSRGALPSVTPAAPRLLSGQLKSMARASSCPV